MIAQLNLRANDLESLIEEIPDNPWLRDRLDSLVLLMREYPLLEVEAPIHTSQLEIDAVLDDHKKQIKVVVQEIWDGIRLEIEFPELEISPDKRHKARKET